MDYSPMYSSTVSLILSLQTGF